MVALAWRACKYKVLILRQRYILIFSDTMELFPSLIMAMYGMECCCLQCFVKIIDTEISKMLRRKISFCALCTVQMYCQACSFLEIRVSNLVFYGQSIIVVISGWKEIREDWNRSWSWMELHQFLLRTCSFWCYCECVCFGPNVMQVFEDTMYIKIIPLALKRFHEKTCHSFALVLFLTQFLFYLMQSFLPVGWFSLFWSKWCDPLIGLWTILAPQSKLCFLAPFRQTLP